MKSLLLPVETNLIAKVAQQLMNSVKINFKRFNRGIVDELFAEKVAASLYSIPIRSLSVQE